MKKFLLLTLLFVFTAAAHAQTDYSKVQMKATKVAGNVYMLEGSGGNIGVSVGDDGLLIVDDQFAPLADKIRAALKGIADKKLKFILNTHWHGDHTGGNIAFGPEATIIAHDNVRKRLATEQKSTVFNSTTPPSPKSPPQYCPSTTRTRQDPHWPARQSCGISIPPASAASSRISPRRTLIDSSLMRTVQAVDIHSTSRLKGRT